VVLVVEMSETWASSLQVL